MSDGAQRRALLLAALATGGTGALEALAPAIARSTSRLGHGATALVATGRPGNTPEQFGADGTTAGDSAGLRAALASDAAAIDLAPRPYSLDADGLTRVALSGKELRGVRGRTVIRLAESPRGDMVVVLDQHDFSIRDIAFDAAGLLAEREGGSYPGFRPCLLVERCARFAVTGCTFAGFDSAGLLANVVSDCTVADNRAERGRPWRP